MPDSSIVKTQIFEIIKNLIEDKSICVTDDTPLISEKSILDSMKLVELCLCLEDKASELGFNFDWTSDVAMSKTHSMFRTANSLASEFITQLETQK